MITAPVTYILRLTEPEREKLFRMLTESLKELRVEIHRTDALAFRAALDEDEALLEGLIEKLRSFEA